MGGSPLVDLAWLTLSLVFQQENTVAYSTLIIIIAELAASSFIAPIVVTDIFELDNNSIYVRCMV